MNIRKEYLNTLYLIIKWEGILGGNLGWRASYPRLVIYYFLYQTKGIFIVGARYCANYLICITRVILWRPYEASTVSGTTFQTVKLQLKEVTKHSRSHKNTTWQAALKLGPSLRGRSSKWALLSLMCMTVTWAVWLLKLRFLGPTLRDSEVTGMERGQKGALLIGFQVMLTLPNHSLKDLWGPQSTKNVGIF